MQEKIEERTILVLFWWERTSLNPFFVVLLHFSMFLFEILNIVSKLNCEAMLKIASKYIHNCRKSKKGPILVGPFLLNLCHSYTLFFISKLKQVCVIRSQHLEYRLVKTMPFGQILSTFGKIFSNIWSNQYYLVKIVLHRLVKKYT